MTTPVASRTMHEGLYSEIGAQRGDRPDRARKQLIKVEDLAWLEFEKPDLDRAERSAHDFGFDTGAAATPDELRVWAERHVPERAAPKQVVVLDSLPVNDVGKPYKPELRRDTTERARDEFVALGLHSLATQPRAELADGTVRVIVPCVADHDEAITQALGRYAFTSTFEEGDQ